MSIFIGAAGVQRVAHDPQTCGLDPDWDCPTCRARAAAVEEAEAERRRQAERRARTAPFARQLVEAIKAHRDQLRAVLLDLLAQEEEAPQ